MQMIDLIQNKFNVFTNSDEYHAWSASRLKQWRIIEDYISCQDVVIGYCDCCEKMVHFQVHSGAMFEHRPNLREGLLCPRGMNNRQRLLLRLVNVFCNDSFNVKLKVALFEDFTPLTNSLKSIDMLDVRSSIYLGEDYQSGDKYKYFGKEIIHENITSTSYAENEIDIVIHNDVLEHLPVYDISLKEIYRILSPGGVMIMTAPFFPDLPETVNLAKMSINGAVEFLVTPPEYHGDPIKGEILAYNRFGWSLLDDLLNAGFEKVFAIVEYDPMSGLTTNNNPYITGFMPPVAIVASK